MKGAEDTRGDRAADGEAAEPNAASKVTGPRVRDSGVDLTPGTEVGRFTIERQLGAGGMGVVYLARDRELDRKVALKLLRTDRDEQPAARAQRRMLREAQAMAAVSHPNLVTIYEAGVYLEHVFLAMEFVDGQSLDDWVESRPRTLEEIVGVYEQAGVALERLHGAGIVHRDFKPDNVMVDGEGKAKLLDLGIARRVALPDDVKSSAVEIAEAKRTGVDVGALSESLSEGAMIGTPAYMAPEQMLGGDVGPEADQFAFALCLYESLCGERPFEGSTELEMISNTIAGIVRPWDEHEHVPEKLRPVIERMLSGRREDRYPSMSAALAAIRESLGVRRQLRLLTATWLRNERKDEYLLPRGELLTEALGLMKQRPASLDDDQKAYLDRCREAGRRRLFTRRALVGSVGALAVGMVPALYLLRQRTKQLEAETRARVENTLDTVAAQIDALFAESTESLRLMLDQREVWMPDVERLLVDGSIDDPAFADQLADATRALNRFFRPVLEHSPTISSLMVCTEAFEYLAFDDISARRLDPPYHFYNRVVNTAVLGDAAFQLFDEEQTEWLERGGRDRRGQPWRGYVPAERIFYRRAARSPAIGWTEPYLFFVTKEAGVTGSSLFQRDGKSYALAVDVTLTDLSQITSGVDTPGVQAVVLTRDGEVVGLPRDDDLRSRENIVSVFARYDAEREGDEAAKLPPLAEVGEERLTVAWEKVRGEGTGLHECVVGDTPFCVGVRPIGREEQDLTLVVVAERR